MAGAILWIILATIVALAFIAIVAVKKKRGLKPLTPNQLIYMGLAFVAAGIVMWFYRKEMNVLMTLGVIFTSIGFIKKYIYKKT